MKGSATHDQTGCSPEDFPEHHPPLTIDVFDPVLVMDRPDPLVSLFGELRYDLARPRITKVDPASGGTPRASGTKAAVLPGTAPPFERRRDLRGGDPPTLPFADGHASSPLA